MNSFNSSFRFVLLAFLGTILPHSSAALGIIERDPRCIWALRNAPIPLRDISLEEAESHLSANERILIEKDIVELVIHDGRFFTWVNGELGKPFSTYPGTILDRQGRTKNTGRAIISVDENQRLWGSLRQVEIFLHHSHLNRAGVSFFPGELKTDFNGKIQLLSYRSGHYWPGPYPMREFLLELRNKGLELNGVQVELADRARAHEAPIPALDFLRYWKTPADTAAEIMLEWLVDHRPGRWAAHEPQLYDFAILFGKSRAVANRLEQEPARATEIMAALKIWWTHYASNERTRVSLAYLLSQFGLEEMSGWNYDRFLSENLADLSDSSLNLISVPLLIRHLMTGMPLDDLEKWILRAGTQLAEARLKLMATTAIVLNGGQNPIALKNFTRDLVALEGRLPVLRAWTLGLSRNPGLRENAALVDAAKEARAKTPDLVIFDTIRANLEAFLAPK